MPEISHEEIQKLLLKYKSQLTQQLQIPIAVSEPITSKEYTEFKKENIPKHISFYEKACNLSEKIIKVKPGKEKGTVLKEAIETCHLNVTPTGTASFAILGPLLFVLFGSLISFVMFRSFFFVFFFFVAGVAFINVFGKFPQFLADTWRLKASNQMVLCIFYVVTYMRHTSNLELAIDFASEHLAPPLSLDLKKVLWDVETERYESVKESLDHYLISWKKYNLEFIEAFHLIESSLYEASEERRLNSLDKALSVILEETYEKMLHYAQNLKSPITMLHMMGIILPILGLVILPLVVSFMPAVKWYHLATIYNIALPIGVYYLGKNILAKRPTGYGDTDIAEDNPQLKKYRNFIINLAGLKIKIPPFAIALLIGTILLLFGLSPVIMHYLNPDPEFDIPIMRDERGRPRFMLLGYKESKETNNIIGPYGLGASILSLFVTLGVGLGIGIYYKLKSQNVIKIRENAKKLEAEFASALFQLGNRLGDGLPAEIAFGKVAGVMEGTISGNFFNIVSSNIRRLGLGLKEAIFNPKIGALVYYPSALIESSMKVLIESVKKGPIIASQALVNVSEYIKEIHRVNERLKDLMADIISSMKSQISFLTPAISGIVVGITSMITGIIGKLGEQIERLGAETMSGGSAPSGIITMFSDGIPTFYFQIMVGIYVIQLCYILTILTNGIENGSDKLNERYLIGVNMIGSTILYSVIALIVILVFNTIAGTVMGSIV